MMPTTSFGAVDSFFMDWDWAFTTSGNAMIKLIKILFMCLYLYMNKCTGIDCFSGNQGGFTRLTIEKKGKKG